MCKSRLLSALVLAAGVAAAGAAAGEEVRFQPLGPSSTPGAVLPGSMPATLSIPAGGSGPMPAVVIAHASAGLTPEGPEADYVVALNAAGIATLVIDMWTPRQVPRGLAAFGGDRGADRRPRSIRDTLPDAFGALKYLAGHSSIDSRRIGVLGFSWGAMLSFLAMSEAAAERAVGGGLRFAAHSAHYFVCSGFLPTAPGAPAMSAAWTDAPLQLQVGGQDDYDGADGGASCRKLIDDLPPEKRRRVELIVYPEATHAWEVKLPFPMTIHDPRSRGGSVRLASDIAAAARARAATVAFFKTAFGL
jgi:uncharacterized protein